MVQSLFATHLLDAPLSYGDETQIQVLKEPGKSAQSKSYMWAQMTQGSGPEGTGPPIRLFGYSASRSTAAAQLLYAGMRPGGVLMTDGYAVYDQIAHVHRLVHLACWAHCRRDFNDALQALPRNSRGPEQLAAKFIALIGQLYAVESRGRDLLLGEQDLLEQRQQRSVLVPTRSLVPMPVPTCTRCCKPAPPTALTAIATCVRYWWHCPKLKR